MSRPDSTRRPIIGISTSELRAPVQIEHSPEAEPPRRELALGLSYPHAVQAGGGVPLVVPPADHVSDELLHLLDGLLLSGGPDLHPDAYGESPDPRLGPTEPELDSFELELARRADSAEIPILAVCRGAQLLNVARGGSLIQDVRNDGIRHRQDQAGEVTTHHIHIDEGTGLATIMGSGEHMVNSFHHQAIRDLGSGLAIVARSPDGLPEAIEALDRAFAVGVQWHAESLVAMPDESRLFEAFIDASRRRMAERFATDIQEIGADPRHV